METVKEAWMQKLHEAVGQEHCIKCTVQKESEQEAWTVTVHYTVKKPMSKFDLASEARKPNAAGCRNFLTDAKFDSAPPLPTSEFERFFFTV
jgi:hypothetical protein